MTDETMLVMSDADLSATADNAKVVVIAALVEEGLLDKDRADSWCESHAVLVRKPGFLFRTMAWFRGGSKHIGDKTHIYTVVKRIV